MKVLLINSVCGVGSTGKICQDIYWGLKRQGNDCKVAWGREKNGNIPDVDCIKIGNNIDIYLHALISRIFDCSGFLSVSATRKLISSIDEYDPDVIHLHNIHGYYLNIDILFNYLKNCGKRIVWTLHDCWAFTGHCAYMDYIGCEKWKNECHDCAQKKDYPVSILFDRSRENFNIKSRIFKNIPNLQLVTPSRWLKKLVEDSFLNEYHTVVINNVVNKEIYKRTNSLLKEKYLIEKKKVVLGVAFPWSRRKGLNDFIKLAKILPEDKYQIILIGLNKSQIQELPKNIIGIGKVKTGLNEWYSIADVFVNPTYEDNYPTVNLEAQCCGAPCITYKTGGSIETTVPDNIVEKGNVVELARLVIERCNEQPKKLFICENEDEFVARYIDIYKRNIRKASVQF